MTSISKTVDRNRFLESYIQWFDKLSNTDKYTMYHGQQRFSDILDQKWMRQTKVSFEEVSFEDYRLLTGEQGNNYSLLTEIKTYVMEILNDPLPKKTVKKTVKKSAQRIKFQDVSSSDSENEIEFL